jgi:hypothetical protein
VGVVGFADSFQERDGFSTFAFGLLSGYLHRYARSIGQVLKDKTI